MKNLYIDESCHLANDNHPCMAIAYIKIDQQDLGEIKTLFKENQKKYHFFVEPKWTSISISKLEFYKSIIDLFFENNISFRCIYINDKKVLNHEKFNNGDEGLYYFKLIYLLIVTPTNDIYQNYNVYIDVKDTQGRMRIKGIKSVLAEKFNHSSPFDMFQHIQSSDSIGIQLSDIFVGAITYKLRKEHLKDNANPAKIEFIKYFESKLGRDLTLQTFPYENKFNIFNHIPQ
ncbi:DUF3800 domain-containing protein [Taibaiella lutea]|uniref:DUF3800 domain-containing protein n=1 Tax=Taibaiella lutea TaxID=2608001 RepID=UPI00167FE116|nr:DUF3800 domain-containing protein [Taibaiella lutea]